MQRMHRGARVLGVLVALSLTVAACGDDDTADEDTGSPADTPAQADHLAIGTLFPESGSLQSIVRALSSPIGLAVDEINAAGGVLGKDVTIASADDGTEDATLAGQGLTRLVTSDRINVLMGPASSTLAEKMMKQIRDANVLACSGSNTAASLEDIDDDGRYFGFAPNDNLQGPALAQVISDDGHSNIAILARNDTYGTGFAKAVDAALEDAGVQVVLNAAYDPVSTLGYKADVDKVAAADPDAVLVLGFGDDGAKVVSQLIESNMGPSDLPVYTADGMQSSGFAAKVNASDPSAVEGIKGTAPAAAPSGVIHPFAEEYAKLGVDTIFSAYYYDCTIAVALAAEQANSLDPNDIAEAMLEVTSGGTPCQTFAECKQLIDEGEDIDYNGASGSLELNERGHVLNGVYDVWSYDATGAVTTLDVPQIKISKE